MRVPPVLHLQLGSGGSLAEESLCLRPTTRSPSAQYTLQCAQLHTSTVRSVSPTLYNEHILKYIVETEHHSVQSTAHSAHTLHPCIKCIVMRGDKIKRV